MHSYCCSLHAQTSLTADHSNGVRHRRELGAVATFSVTLPELWWP